MPYRNRYKRSNSRPEADIIYASIEQPKRKAQMFIPDDLYQQVIVDAFKQQPSKSWLVPTKRQGEYLLYRLSVDTTSKGRSGHDTLLVVDYLGLADANGKQIGQKPSTTGVITGTPVVAQPTLAEEIAKIQALHLDQATQQACINALVLKYSGGK